MASHASFRTLASDHAFLLSLLLAATVFAIDLCLPLGVASAVPYTFAVLLAVNARPRWYAASLALLCAAIPASASIAVFTDGRNMKIDSYEVEEDTIHLVMSGGKLSLPLTRI